MVLFGIIIAKNQIVNPYLSAVFGVDVIMPIPPEMWGLLKIGMGGYIVGRSIEKGVKTWKQKDAQNAQRLNQLIVFLSAIQQL